MPNTYTIIASNTVGSGGASTVTLSSIPQTGYTDFVVKVSARSSRTTGGTDNLRMAINGSSSNFTFKNFFATGGSASSDSGTIPYMGDMPQQSGSSGWTANTFGSYEIYIPNYTSSNNKSISVDYATENNATTNYNGFIASLWSQTDAITSLTFTTGGAQSFVEHSTFTLYGITKS
jgi:hypothetical protein